MTVLKAIVSDLCIKFISSLICTFFVRYFNGLKLKMSSPKEKFCN